MARMTQGQSIAEAAAIATEVERERGALKIKRLEAENARLQFELTAARNEIEIADGVIKRLQAKNARLRAEAIVSKCGRELEKN